VGTFDEHTWGDSASGISGAAHVICLGPGGAEADLAAAADQYAEPAGRRRRALAGAGKPSSNGVDSAAVRAWAGASGLTSSPRGRIKIEVLQAYRAAGN
jgi:hypothetical protein